MREAPLASTGMAAYFARCFAFVLAFGLGAWLVTRVGTIALMLAAAVLAAPAAVALLHRGTVRRLSRLHEFAPGHWLHTWAARRIVTQFTSAVGALVLALVVLLQSPFFGRLEWGLVVAAPFVFVAVAAWASRRLRPSFYRPVYATSATLRSARWVTFVLLCLAWLGGRYWQAAEPAQPIGTLVHTLQDAWPQTPSMLVRWALDATAWTQALLASFGHAADAPAWRMALALTVLPLTLFAYVTWSVAGLAVGRGELRRIFANVLTESDTVGRAGRRRVVTAGAIAAGVVAAAVLGAVYTEALLRESGRGLAVRALPECERLGGTAYAIGTLAKIDAYHEVLERGIAARKHDACARVGALRGALERQVDAYLDWYFSFGADITQTVLLATGEVGALLEFKLNRLVADDPQVTMLIGELDADAEYLRRVSDLARSGITDLLEGQRLVLDADQCRVVTARADDPARWRVRDEHLQARLLAGGVGAAVGGFAGALAGRAMGRASMQAARRVMGRLGVKLAARGTSAATGAGAGATVGSAVPGPGTVVGSIVGAVAGWVATDLALLAAEEKLTRATMRADLLATVDETLRPLRTNLGCAGS